MNITEWRFGNVLATCGFVGMAVGTVALFMTGSHLFYIPIGLGMMLVFLKDIIM